MVEQQIRTWEVLDQAVLDLLYAVPREDFVRALTADRQATTMSLSTVAIDTQETLHVLLKLTTKVTFYLEVQLDVVAQRDELVIGQILYADLPADCGVGEGLECPRTANTVDVSQCDLNALIARDVDAG